MRISSLIIILWIVSGCVNTTQTTETNHSGQNEISENKAIGYWVVADYIDSIIIDRSIAKHRIKPLTWGALQVEVTDTGLIFDGTIMQNTFIHGSIRDGVILPEEVSGNNYYYTYNAASDILTAMNTKDSTRSRYIRTNESFLYKDSAIFHKLEPKLHSFFVANAFAGTYVSIATKDTVIFDPKYTMSGMGEFKQYSINMFMGTSHPFNDGDLITYYGDNVNAINYFEFKGDTLVLFSYKDHPQYGGDSYIKDKEVMRLLKVK